MDPKKAQDAHNALRSAFDTCNLQALGQYARLLQRLNVREIKVFNCFLIPGA